MTVRYKVIDCVQNSPEWHEARRGIPTASRYGDMIAEGEGKTRLKYLRQIAAEVITEEPMKTYSNEKMERGRELEDGLRKRYSYEYDVDVEQVGFLRSLLTTTGCSPDGLVGADGVLEVKSTEPPNLIEILETRKIPTVHNPQIQGILWITGRKWCDLVIGWPKMPLSRTRIERDEPFMAKLQIELQRFLGDLNALVSRLRGM